MGGGPDIRKQELHCHACDRYVQFEIDVELDGNHVLNCPNCGHEHCRVVKDGVITDARWDSRNRVWGNGSAQTFAVMGATTSASSNYDTYSGGDATYSLWMDSTTSNTANW